MKSTQKNPPKTGCGFSNPNGIDHSIAVQEKQSNYGKFQFWFTNSSDLNST